MSPSLASRLRHLRVLALALPLFALFSTAQVGCSGSAVGYGVSPTSDVGDDCTGYGVYESCDGYGYGYDR